MTYEQPSSLSFSIKESVWLNRGSEIDELLSLVLEPDINIQENGDQVLVRGNLQLYGEYRPKEEEQNSAGTFADQVSFRSVEEVSMSDDGIGLIRHSFPLDVTIPKERIENLDNLFVTVDEFDYELPGKGCIELEANVSVSGIKSEQTKSPEPAFAEARYNEWDNVKELPTNVPDHFEDARVSYNEYQYEEPNVSEEHVQHFQPQPQENERSFHFEAVRPEEDDSNEDYVVENVNDEDSRYHGQEFGEVEENSQHIGSDNGLEQQSYEAESYNHSISEEAHDPILESEKRTEPPSSPTVNFASNTNAAAEPDETVASEDTEEGHSEQKREENALYLTKMLTKGEDEFSKLRMCIVQDGETIDTIAERYNIQVSQLVRMNSLNEDRVSAGEIIYIPVRKSVPSDS